MNNFNKSKESIKVKHIIIENIRKKNYNNYKREQEHQRESEGVQSLSPTIIIFFILLIKYKA